MRGVSNKRCLLTIFIIVRHKNIYLGPVNQGIICLTMSLNYHDIKYRSIKHLIRQMNFMKKCAGIDQLVIS